MSTYIPLKNLEIYQLSMEIGKMIWEVVGNWNYFEKDTIGKQFVRSADSIAANISEGYGRYHFGERKLFCYYSRGSLSETLTWLQKANERSIINQAIHDELFKKLNELHIKLNIYIKTIKENITSK